MCNFLWRINGLTKHLLLNKPTNMDENSIFLRPCSSLRLFAEQ